MAAALSSSLPESARAIARSSSIAAYLGWSSLEYFAGDIFEATVQDNSFRSRSLLPLRQFPAKRAATMEINQKDKNIHTRTATYLLFMRPPAYAMTSAHQIRWSSPAPQSLCDMRAARAGGHPTQGASRRGTACGHAFPPRGKGCSSATHNPFPKGCRARHR